MSTATAKAAPDGQPIEWVRNAAQEELVLRMGLRWDVRTFKPQHVTSSQQVRVEERKLDETMLWRIGRAAESGIPLDMPWYDKHEDPVDGCHRTEVAYMLNSQVTAYAIREELTPELRTTLGVRLNQSKGRDLSEGELRMHAIALADLGRGATAIAQALDQKPSTIETWIRTHAVRKRAHALKLDVGGLSDEGLRRLGTLHNDATFAAAVKLAVGKPPLAIAAIRDLIRKLDGCGSETAELEVVGREREALIAERNLGRGKVTRLTDTTPLGRQAHKFLAFLLQRTAKELSRDLTREERGFLKPMWAELEVLAGEVQKLL